MFNLITQVATYKSGSFLAPLNKGGWGDLNLVITAEDPPSAPLIKGGTSPSVSMIVRNLNSLANPAPTGFFAKIKILLVYVITQLMLILAGLYHQILSLLLPD